MSHIHVKDRETGHEYPVPERLFNPDAHEKTGKPAYDRHGDLVAMKPKTTVTQAAAKKSGAKKSATSARPTDEAPESEG